MKVSDRVTIRRGVWKGYTGTVTQVIGSRVGVQPQVTDEWKEQHPFAADPMPVSLASTSVELA